MSARLLLPLTLLGRRRGLRGGERIFGMTAHSQAGWQRSARDYVAGSSNRPQLI